MKAQIFGTGAALKHFASGPATDTFNGLDRESYFLALKADARLEKRREGERMEGAWGRSENRPNHLNSFLYKRP